MKRPSRLPTIGVAAASAAIAAVVFGGALSYGFSQDDFLGLARASGLAPRLGLAWRPLSHQWFWDAMRAVAGLDPRPYHAVSLALHAACAALVGGLLARRFAWPAALAGGAFFAAHGSLYTAVYWIAANGDVQATLLALLALALFLGAGRARWGAIPAFALSLLAKESTLLFPLLALLARPPARAGGPWWRRDPVLLGLFAVSAIALAAFVLRDPFSSRDAAGANLAYRADAGAVLPNLLTYAGWTADAAYFTVRSFADQVERSVFPWGLALLALWLAGAALPALRARGWLLAGAGSLAMLAPVLPLAHHTYHYYLYAALPWTALGVAAACDATLSAAAARAPRLRAGAAAACAALAAALAFNGVVLVARIENMPFFLPLLRADATVDRALIATRVADALRAARLPRGAALAFWSPVSIEVEARKPGARADLSRETYWEANVRAALLDGLAVRVLFPEVASVRFEHAFSPEPAGQLWAVYVPDGRLEVFTADSLARRFARRP